MNKKKICEALYALPGGVVVCRRKSITAALWVLLVGAGALGVNYIWGAAWSNNIRAALVLVGGVAVFAGAGVLFARLCGGGGTPYHVPTKRRLRYEALYFDVRDKDLVASCVAGGDATRLRALPRAQVPAVAVAVYATPDGCFQALQAFEYADLEYRPLSGLKIVGV